MKWKCFAELFGAFRLVFAGTGAVIVDHITGGGVMHVGIALTFGLAMALTAILLVRQSQFLFGY